MKKLIAILAGLLVLAGPVAQTVRAQGWPAGRVHSTLLDNYDLVATSLTYPVFVDKSAVVSANFPLTGVLGPGVPVNKKIKTTGASTSVTANTASTAPFQGLAVGDLLILLANDTTTTLPQAGIEFERTIATFTDVNNVVVDSNIDLTGGFTFRYKKLLVDATANGGWFDVSGFDSFTVQIQVDTINATSIDGQLECRGSKFGAAFTQAAWQKNFTAVGAFQASVTSRQEECRVGWKVNTDTGVQSIAAYFIGGK